jgi:hypothetical protein
VSREQKGGKASRKAAQLIFISQNQWRGGRRVKGFSARSGALPDSKQMKKGSRASKKAAELIFGERKAG